MLRLIVESLVVPGAVVLIAVAIFLLSVHKKGTK